MPCARAATVRVVESRERVGMQQESARGSREGRGEGSGGEVPRLARLHQLAQLGCGADTLERELPSGGAQRRGDVVMAVPNRLTQRRHARRVLRRRIRSPLEQRPHGWHTAKGCSHVQRGPSVEVPRVGVGANLERQAEGHRLPAVSERLQLRRRGEPVGAERPSARVEQASEPGVRRTHRLVEGREAAAIDGVDAGAALQQ